MSHRITRDALEQMMTAGKSAADIAAAIGCSPTTVYNHLRKHGLTFKDWIEEGITRFGKLLVLHRDGDSNTGATFTCLCDCGRTSVGVRRSCLVTGNTKTCGCSRERRGPASPSFKGYGEIPGKYWSSVLAAAKSRNLAVHVTIGDAWALFEQQRRLCKLSGLPIGFSRRGRGTASLDRKDSTEAYTLENVQWVHKTINVMKQNLTDEGFISLCAAVARHNNA